MILTSGLSYLSMGTEMLPQDTADNKTAQLCPVSVHKRDYILHIRSCQAMEQSPRSYSEHSQCTFYNYSKKTATVFDVENTYALGFPVADARDAALRTSLYLNTHIH